MGGGLLSCAYLPQADVDLAWAAASYGLPGLFTVLNGGKPKHCHHNAPSTGLMGVLHALRMCKSVRLFGFTQPSNGTKYYNGTSDALEGQQWPFHNASNEHSILMSLLILNAYRPAFDLSVARPGARRRRAST